MFIFNLGNKSSAASVTIYANSQKLSGNQTDDGWRNLAANVCRANTVHAMYFNRVSQSDSSATFYIHAFSHRCGTASSSAPNVYNQLTSVLESPSTGIDLSQIIVPKTFYSGVTLAPGNFTPIYAYGPFTIQTAGAGTYFFNISYKVGSFGNSTNSGQNGLTIQIVDDCTNIAGVQRPVPTGYVQIGNQCGRRPSLLIDASCANGKVVVSYTTNDLDGGSLTASFNASSGSSLWAGTKTETKASGNYNLAGSPFTFSGAPGVTYKITGTVKDSLGLESSPMSEKTYVCSFPSAVECEFTSPNSNDFESGQTIVPVMKVKRNATVDLGGATLTVTATATNTLNSLTYPNTTVTISNSNPERDVTYSPTTFTETNLNPGVYEISGSISWAGGSYACPKKVYNVIKKPFFQVTNGDLLVGATSNCSDSLTSGGNLFSWATGDASFSAASRKGASAQYVAQVFGEVKDFYSASGVTNTTTNTKKYLTLANDSDGGEWGGNFGIGACLKDVYTNTKRDDAKIMPFNSTLPYTVFNPADPANPSQVEFGSEANPAKIAIKGITNFTGNIAVYVTGDVFIGNDGAGNPANFTLSPGSFFALIVKGNIYIDFRATTIEGMLIAQDNSNGGGIIYTCGLYYGDFYNMPINSMYTNCNNKLTVNGIVQAKEIKLHRTFGSLNGVAPNNAPAEVFNGRPELYFVPNPFSNSNNPGTSADTRYDSITNLPPLL